MNTARKPGPHTHTRTEGRAPVWRWLSEFTTKAATNRGEYRNLCPACALVNEVAWAYEFSQRQRAPSVDRAGLEVEEHPAGKILATQDLVSHQIRPKIDAGDASLLMGSIN